MNEYTQNNVLNLFKVVVKNHEDSRVYINLYLMALLLSCLDGVNSKHFGTFENGRRAFNKLKELYL